MSSYYEWECTDCGDRTYGAHPETVCRCCGQGNIIRDIALAEAEAWGDVEPEFV